MLLLFQLLFFSVNFTLCGEQKCCIINTLYMIFCLYIESCLSLDILCTFYQVWMRLYTCEHSVNQGHSALGKQILLLQSHRASFSNPAAQASAQTNMRCL